jgi:hypothetical protein
MIKPDGDWTFEKSIPLYPIGEVTEKEKGAKNQSA